MIYRFNQFEVDDQAFRVLADGTQTPLEPKPLRLLLYLIENRNRLVRKQELLDALWNDTFVTENTLTRSVGMLRKALGDDAREPKFIETVPTVGYRFMAAVEILPELAPMPHLTSSGPVEHPAAHSELSVEAPSVADLQAKGGPLPESSVRTPRFPNFKLRWLLLAAGLSLLTIFCLWALRQRLYAGTPIRSLAVLPLDDLSPGTREDYFADGLTDELITELARIPGLRVVSRTSVMQDKGARKPLALLARELDVDAIVEGSVVRSGDRVRITAQLIDARNDKHLWAKSFEGPLGDILSLQDSVAREISAQTRAVLTPAARTELTNARHVDPAAYDAYLRGLYFIQRRDGNLAASYFRKAIALEPDYAAANAGLAEALVTQSLINAEDAAAIMPSAIAAANRAIQLDPYSGEAYTALGAIDATYLWDWNGADHNLRKGIELSPSSSDAETWYAVYLTSVGRPSEAVSAMQRAVALDPLSFWANRLLGSMLFYSRRYDESLVALERAREIAPDKLGFVVGWYPGIFEMQGRYADAVEADIKQSVSELSPQDIDSFRSAFRTGGWKAYQEARVKFLLRRSESECLMNPLAISYVRLGNIPEAIRWFNRDVDDRCGMALFTLASDPRLDKIRGDERFRVLLGRVNLPQ